MARNYWMHRDAAETGHALAESIVEYIFKLDELIGTNETLTLSEVTHALTEILEKADVEVPF